MDAAAPPVAFAVGPEEAPELARLFDRPGPFATITLATDATIDNAAHRSMQHWRPVRDELEAAGAPAPLLDAVEALVPEAHHEGPAVFVVADESGVLLTRAIDESFDRDTGRLAALPAIAPLIEWRQRNLPHIVVVADRAGADIDAVVPYRDPVSHTEGGDPKDPAIRKSQPGGWSQRRYQERAENTWEANAKAVADRVNDIADLIAPRLILVAGDTRAVGYLQEHLHQRHAPLVREIGGSRGADGSDDAIAEDARKQVQTATAEDTVAYLEKFREEKGQRDRAVEGVAATIEALNAAQVETLLVHDGAEEDRRAWYAADAGLIALDRQTLEGYGVESPLEGRLLDALIRTAFKTGARVRIVPSTTASDGVGGILRFTS